MEYIKGIPEPYSYIREGAFETTDYPNGYPEKVVGISDATQAIAYALNDARKENERLRELINNPELNDFLEGVKIESAHQTEKWGDTHDATKYPANFSEVMDYLKGKMTVAGWEGDKEKYKHHLITQAAVCYNAFKQFSNPESAMNKYFDLP